MSENKQVTMVANAAEDVVDEFEVLSLHKESVHRTVSVDSGVHMGSRSLPSYSVNIYETLMIFTLNVSLVEEASLQLDVGGDNFGLVFKDARKREFELDCQFRRDNDDESGDQDVEVETEVWDNNVLLKVRLAPVFDAYRLSNEPERLVTTQWAKLPKFKQAGARTSNKSSERSSSSSNGAAATESAASLSSIPSVASTSSPAVVRDEVSSSRACFSTNGSDSDDSALLSTSPNSSQAIEETLHEVRGILKSSRSSSQLETSTAATSETGLKKSVSFSERVQRYTFRANSSILGRRHKNQHKRAQKSRRQQRLKMQNQEDDDDVSVDSVSKSSQGNRKTTSKKETPTLLVHHEEDSGVASSMEECEASGFDSVVKAKKSRKGKKRSDLPAGPTEKQPVRQNNDLMFDIDF